MPVEYFVFLGFVNLRAVKVAFIIQANLLANIDVPANYILETFMILLCVGLQQSYVFFHIGLEAVLLQDVQFPFDLLIGLVILQHLLHLLFNFIYNSGLISPDNDSSVSEYTLDFIKALLIKVILCY
mgnify:CR=1 FL=1